LPDQDNEAIATYACLPSTQAKMPAEHREVSTVMKGLDKSPFRNISVKSVLLGVIHTHHECEFLGRDMNQRCDHADAPHHLARLCAAPRSKLPARKPAPTVFDGQSNFSAIINNQDYEFMEQQY
jgi:hypothetical protein